MPHLASLENCTGCAACYNKCPKHIISMEMDKEGFLFPVVDDKLCVECGACEKACPVVAPLINHNKVNPKTYAIWSDLDRTRSSSGGAFSALSRYVLSLNGVVFGAEFTDNFECSHKAVDSIEALDSLRGSKYVQSDINDSYAQAKELLKQDRWVLFSGTPCQIAGLYGYLQYDYPKLITTELVCHGVPSSKLLKSYIDRLAIKKRGNIKKISFRKSDGWEMRTSIQIGENTEILYGIDNLYMEAFNKSALFRKSCYNCPYAKIPRLADCTIGDFWGIGKYGIPFKHNNSKGVSLLLINNDKGKMLFSHLENCFIEERTIEEASVINHNLKSPSKLCSNRDVIISSFLNQEMSLTDIERRFNIVDRSLKNTLKILLLRFGVIDFAKKIYRVIFS